MKSSTKQKLWALALGLVFAAVVLELGIRLTGFVFTTVQEKKNKEAMQMGDSYRILCLGDSMTAGMWPRQLQEVLDEGVGRGRVAVFDRARPGTNSDYVLQVVDRSIEEFQPGMIIVMMGYNDGFELLPYGNVPVREQEEAIRSVRLGKLLWYNLTEGLPGNKDSEGNPLERIDFDSSGPLDVWSISIGAWRQVQLAERIEAEPHNDKAMVDLAWLLRKSGRRNEAEPLFRQAAEANPANSEALYELGRLSFDGGRLKEARDYYERCLEHDPRQEKAYANLREVYEALHDLEAIGRMYRRSLEKMPDVPWLYDGLSGYLRSTGHEQEAEAARLKAHELRMATYNPRTLRNYTLLAEFCRERGVQLVAMQYPTLGLEPLKKLLEGREGVLFVDNERSFLDATASEGTSAYFDDMFGGSFGHCTSKGNLLIARNIADVIMPVLEALPGGRIAQVAGRFGLEATETAPDVPIAPSRR